MRPLSLLQSWTQAGQDPAHFWRLTPREIGVILNGSVARLRYERNERAWLAWHTAALGRIKRFPRLAGFLHGAEIPQPRRRRQSAEEQIAIAQIWMASAKARARARAR